MQMHVCHNIKNKEWNTDEFCAKKTLRNYIASIIYKEMKRTK